MRKKIIMCSCAMCYAIGLWIIASRFGVVKIAMHYRFSELFTELPKNFPQMEYLWGAVAAYTLAYLLVAWIIYKVVSTADAEQAELQSNAAEVNAMAAKMAALVASHRNYAKTHDITDRTAMHTLRHIQRQIAALPPTVTTNHATRERLMEIITSIEATQNEPSSDYSAFCSILEAAVEEIDQIKMKTLIISY